MQNILIFNDLSGLGNCSMSANLPIFTKLGHYCMPIVTANFSCQTGFEKFTFQKNGELSRFVADITANRAPDAVYVGFCVDEKLLSEVSDAVEKIRRNNGAFVFVDPILGDNGKLYPIFSQSYAEKMKTVVKNADCISPNLTEACLLADVDFGEVVSHSREPAFLAYCGKIFADFLQKTGAKSAVITGVECGELIGNVVLQHGCAPKFVTNNRVPVNFSGTGDTFSSVVCGEMANGVDLLSATEIAANFVCKAATLTQCADRRFGVEFCRVLNLL